jgi:hypothetical protein
MGHYPKPGDTTGFPYESPFGKSGYSGFSGYSGVISEAENDHSLLSNLDFEDSGHINFQKKLTWEQAYLAFLINN